MSVAFDADCDGDQRDSGTDVCDDSDRGRGNRKGNELFEIHGRVGQWLFQQ